MNDLVDRRATEILFSSFWSSAGWKPEAERKLPREDFLYTKSKGVMFDPVSRSKRCWAIRAGV
jgi:phosphoglycerol transferase MdoB-like AlkP superfamily enzyme